jgi:4'-phosphopantetheinyl transferase
VVAIDAYVLTLSHAGDVDGARSATRAILARSLDVAPGDVEISRRCLHCGHPDHGKPLVVGAPDLSFSMSHSGAVGLVAVARGAAVGADVEVVRPRRRLERLAARTMSPAEHDRWRAVAPDEQLDAFLALWTAKEAQLKATGRGITVALRSVPASPDGWTIAPVAIPGAVAHVAVDRADATVSVSDGTAG